MNLTIKNLSSLTPYFKLMDGENEFCMTRNHKTAILIQKMFAETEPESTQIESKTITPADILQKIHKLKKVNLRTNLSRTREIANLRFVYYNLAGELGYTLREIGALIYRDHASVLSGIVKCSNYCDTDPNFRELYNEIKNSIL